MKCRKVQKQLPAYLERVLDVHTRDTMDAHMDQCPICQQELEAYRRTLVLARQTEIEYPSPDLWESFLPDLYARIDAEESTPPVQDPMPWLRRPRWQLVGATVCLLMVAWFAFHGWDVPQEQDDQTYLSPVEVISATLINDVQAQELRQLNLSAAVDPFVLVTDALEYETKPDTVELRFDLAVLEETLALPEEELWSFAAYQDTSQHMNHQ